MTISQDIIIITEQIIAEKNGYSVAVCFTAQNKTTASVPGAPPEEDRGKAFRVSFAMADGV